MKKIYIIALFSIIAVMIVYFIIPLYSEETQENKTIKFEKERLNQLNQIPRLYIYEGVYSFEQSDTREQSEFAFTSKQIVIKQKDFREEIELSNPYLEAFLLSETSTAYYFPVVKWRVYRDNVCVFQYDSIENEFSRKENRQSGSSYFPPTMVLDIRNESGLIKASLTIFSVFAEKPIEKREEVPFEFSKDPFYQSMPKRITKTHGMYPGLNCFKTVGSIKIGLEDLKYKTHGRIPEYVHTTRYE